MIIELYRNTITALKEGFESIYFLMFSTPVRLPVKRRLPSHQERIRQQKMASKKYKY